jgi:NADPH2:quinone reductase
MSLASRAVRTTRLLTSSHIASARLASLNSQLDRKAFHIRKMSSLPKTMKAVQIEKTGGTDVLQYKTDVPVPEPKEGEVLVKNEFIGINYIDT